MLLRLPPELLGQIVSYIQTARDLDSLTKVNRSLHHLFTYELYRRNVVEMTLGYAGFEYENADNRFRNGLLVWAAIHGRIETVQRAISLGVDIHEAWEALEMAIQFDTMDVVEPLLAESANLRAGLNDASGSKHIYYLDAAIEKRSLQSVDVLLRNGADPNTPCSCGMYMDIPFNYTDAAVTPLQTACYAGDPSIVELLVKYGANISPKVTEDNLEPLALASANPSSATVELLLKLGVLPQETLSPAAVLHLACQNSCLDSARVLIEHYTKKDLVGDESHMGPLAHAALTGRLETVTFLLDHGADMEDMHWPSLNCAAYSSNLDLVRQLVSRGADVNFVADASNPMLLRPLQGAAVSGHADIVEFLLNNGAKVDLCRVDDDRTHSNHTVWSKPPIWLAAERGYSKVVELLIKHGANIRVVPLTVAVQSGNYDVVKQLICAGVDIHRAIGRQ